MDVTTCDQQGDIMIDAIGRDLNGQLVFLSIYGRDGSVQQLLSRMQLSQHADRVTKVTTTFPGRPSKFEALVGDPRRLQKVTCRLPKQCLFGPLVHGWIFDPELTTPDRVNGRGWLTFDAGHSPQMRKGATWSLVKHLSPIPLLDEWKDFVLTALRETMVDEEAGHRCLSPTPSIGPIELSLIQLPSSFEALISESIRNGKLFVPTAAAETA